MNARARVMQHGSLFHGSFRRLAVNKEMLGMVLLIGLMLISAISVVYVKNYERHVFSQLQSAQSTREHLRVQWGQLLLEQSTWATPARVQMLAIRHFAMHMPSESGSVLVRM